MKRAKIRGLFHVHGRRSFDSFMSYRKIVDYGVRQGLDFIAVTDHDTVKGCREARRYVASRYPGSSLQVISGIECSSDAGNIIGLFVEEDIACREAAEVIAEIRRQGWLVVLPHPLKDHELSRELLEGIDLVETTTPGVMRC